MRIFLSGLMVVAIVSLVIIIFIPDTVEKYNDFWDKLLWWAFICGALSRAIKEFKGDDIV